MRLSGNGLISVICFVVVLILFSGLTPSAYADNLVVYGDSISAGWANYSWSATVNPAATAPVHAGTHSMSVKLTGAWGALYLGAVPTADMTGYNRLTFWINGGAAGGQQLRLIVNKDDTHTIPITPTANTWTKVDVLLSELGSPSTITDIWVADAIGASQPVFYIDDFAIVNEAGAAPVIYKDSLGSGWDNWSWGGAVNTAATAPVHAGTHSVSVNITDAWGAFYLHADPSIELANYDSLVFWIHGGTTGGQQLQLKVNGDNTNTVAVTATANKWTKVIVHLSDLGSPAGIADIFLEDAKGTAQPIFYLDDISFVTVPVPGPALTVNTGLGRHTISEDIYGMNFASEQLAKELKLPVDRWGGNGATRYNWKIDTLNTDFDWFFENIPQDNPNPAILPDGSTTDRFVEQNIRTGTKSLITVPMIGWTPKRRTDGHPFDCGFKVSEVRTSGGY